MKKNVLFKKLQLVGVSVASLFVMQTIGYGQCDFDSPPSITSGCDDGLTIHGIDMFTLEHDDGTFIYDDGCAGGEYVDLTTTVLNLTVGEIYNGYIESFFNGSAYSSYDIAAIYIDYDQSETFTNTINTEVNVIGQVSQGGSDQSFSLQIPQNAHKGQARMRVVLSWDFVDPCEILQGQILDLTVNIIHANCPSIIYACMDGGFYQLGIDTDDGSVAYSEVCNEGAGGYSDHTSTVLEMTAGESYDVAMSTNPSIFAQYGFVWIDYNQDGILTLDERTVLGQIIWGDPYPITIPNNALTGQTLMRVGIRAHEVSDDPCYWDNGSAVDYTVNIAPPNNPQLCNDYPIITSDEIDKYSASFTWGPNIHTGGQYQIRHKKQGAAVQWTYTYLPGDATSVTLNGLHPDTDYYISARRMCEGGSSYGGWMPIDVQNATQGQFSTLPLETCDYPPTPITAEDITKTSMVIHWTPVDNISAYNLRYKVAGASSPWTHVYLDELTTSYTLNNLSVGTDYYVQLRTMCNNYDNYSIVWSVAEMFTTEDFGECDTPPTLEVEEVASNKVLLSWTATEGVEMYDIRYKKAGVGGWMHKFVPGDQQSTWLTGLAPGVSYYVQVSAKCIGSNVYGNRSPAITVTPTAQSGGSGLAKYEDEITSDEVKVNDEISVTSNIEVVMYPNPTSGVLNIDVVLNEMMESGDVQVHVYDMSGRVVNNTSAQINNGFNNVRLNLGELTTGLYNVVLYQDGVAIHRGKVQKQ